MIEFGLIFAAGFLAALLLALLLAPFFWRRAVTLTGRRIAAAVPTTVAEARAEKDQIRADYAMRMRKLEIGMERAREKVALTEAAIGRFREENRLLDAENNKRGETVDTLESEIRELNRNVAERTQQVAELKKTNGALEKRLAKAEASLGKLKQSLERSEGEKDDLAADLDVERVRVDASRRERERLVERLALQDGELQNLLDRLSESTRQVNRERERSGLMTQRLEELGEPVDQYDSSAVSAAEPEVREKASGTADPLAGNKGSDTIAYASALRAENELLRSQLEQLRSMTDNSSGRDRQMNALREALDRFAEETVAAAAASEGQDGTINQLLAGEQDGRGLSARFANRLSGKN
ncbi:hypothetical protein [Notoacmeibacter ruber]|uniref:Uncharacterized protein n=1 Tax=Notoacmeibacter ruber TaxID=2670375 RepID=A0A3L7JFK2_9HYPH|nr:hypothetical protein [Notoacmeibacter ruber]RLQ88371.1 hypothetical protein D8780_09300 [Notoacmeibacter ruber]